MRNRERINLSLKIAALVAYVALGLYLVGTSGKNRSINDKRTELVLAVPSGVMLTPIYREAVEKFEQQNPDISVKLLEISGKFYQKVTVMIAGGDVPDLMWMGQSFAEFADRDIFLDITDRVKAEIDISEYPPEIISLYMKGDRYYGLPYGIDASFVVYNRKMFSEAGLADPRPDWTYDEFLSVARKLIERDSRGRITRFAMNTGLPYDLFDARVFDPGTGMADCNTPNMIEWIKVNRKLANEERIIPNSADSGELGSDTLGLFKQGKVAMLVSHTMRWDRMFDLFRDMDWGVTLLPKVKRQAQWASSQAICISQATSHPDEAWRLCKYFQSKEFQMAMSVRCFPANKKYAAEFIDNSGNTAYDFNVMHKVLQLLTPMPRVPNLQELTSIFHRYTNDAFVGALSPEEAMQRCESEINRRRRKILEHTNADREY